MTALYIIAGIVAYLLIGSVVVGVALRTKALGIDNASGASVVGWPLIVALLCIGNVLELLGKFAKRIGGVK